MVLNNLNLNNLKVFAEVFKTKCMTTASRQLHLTQSGVSQHIKNLETSLDCKLFDRVNKSLLPTEEGSKLFLEVDRALELLESSVNEISQKEVSIDGTVKIGMPIEFGINLVIPRLVKIGQKYPRVKFMLSLGYASEMNDLLLSGHLDMAVIDEYKMDNKIEIQRLAEETLHLCCTQSYLQSKNEPASAGKKFYESLDYMAYKDGALVVRSWLNHHIKRKNLNLNIRAQVMDVQAISRFVVRHFGAGVLPHQLVEQLKSNGHSIVCLPESHQPLRNSLSLSFIKNRSHGPTTRAVIDELLQGAPAVKSDKPERLKS